MDWSSDSDVSLESDWDEEAETVTSPNLVASPSNKVSEAGPSHTKCTSHLSEMGFSKELVEAAIKQNREGDTEGVLETLLTYQAIEKSAEHEESTANCSLTKDKSIEEDDFSDLDDFEFENFNDEFSDKDYILSTLVDMGFLAEEASSAMDRCGPNASVSELADSIRAAQLQEEFGYQDLDSPTSSFSDYEVSTYNSSKRKKMQKSGSKKKNERIHTAKQMKAKKDGYDDDIHPLAISKHMTGFNLPFEQLPVTDRKLPKAASGTPFFYFENVALAPQGTWKTMSRFLYDVEPEFVDSVHFCAAARKRGYIHNLPIKNRKPLLPIPPKTIHEAFPATRKWWPPWDSRTHLNCIQTCFAPPKLTNKICIALDQYEDPPPQHVQKYVLYECRKWNLVWLGHHKAITLEPDEIEMLLGFPKNHTRGLSRSDRYKALGNSFQVDTVAYHLSVLKDMFPSGINVLSLFSGIGGAEVALHRLGIRLKTVISVEQSKSSRTVVKSWWEQTEQTGTLIEIFDVRELNGNRVKHFIEMYGGFHLVIGGSPCNNLAGSNRHSRVGIEGKQSILFHDYIRILDLVKCAMGSS